MLLALWRCVAHAINISAHSRGKLVALLLISLMLPSVAVHADDIKYYYDEAGRLVQVTGASGSAQYRYDTAGNLIEVIKTAATNPVIAEVTPNEGPVGTVVTIVGQGFSATATSNTVKFNGTTATVLSAGINVLTAAVPAGATTGKITVKVGTKTATSPNDFIVTANQVDMPPRIQSFTPAIGVPGDLVTVTGSGFGNSLQESWVQLNGVRAEVVSLSDSQIVFIVPQGGTPGKIQIRNRYGSTESTDDYFVVPPSVTIDQVAFTGRLAVDVPFAVPSLAADKVAIILFEAYQGQHFGLGLSPVAMVPSNGWGSVSVRSPRGTDVLSAAGFNNATSFDIEQIAFSGPQALILRAPISATLTTTISVLNDIPGALVANQPGRVFSSSQVGLNARYSFDAMQGQSFSLVSSGSSFETGAIYIRDPAGITLAQSSIYYDPQNPIGIIDLPNVPASGTYTVFVTPSGASTGQASVALLGDDAGALSIDGPAKPISLAVGQNGRYTFSGTVGQTLGLGLSNFSTTPPGGSVYVRVIDSQNTTVTNCNQFIFAYTAPGGSCDIARLPADGIYTVIVDPVGSAALNVALTLSNDLEGTLIPNGPPLDFSTSKVGQNARYIFNGRIGQRTTLAWGGTTFSIGELFVYDPDGARLLSTTFQNNDPPRAMDLPTLPADGDYLVFMSGIGIAVGNLSLSLKQDDVGNLEIDGAVKSVSLASGQNGRYTFSGTEGRTLGLGISNLVTTPAGGGITVKILKPDGNVLTDCNPYPNPPYIAPGAGCDIARLPVNGIYTVLIDANTHAVTLDLTLSKDLEGELSTDQAAQLFASSRVGQNGRYTFNATAGGSGIVSWDGGTFPGYVHVLNPQGVEVHYGYFSNGSRDSTGPINFNETGKYTVFINPYSPGVHTGQVNLSLESGKPDFSVSPLVTVGEALLTQEGYSVPVTYEVRNTSSTAVNVPWTDAAYLSADGAIDISDVEIARQARATNIPPHGVLSQRLDLLFPLSTPPGAVTAIIGVDAMKVVDERSETNNTAVFTVQLGQQPDLVASNLSVSNIGVDEYGKYTMAVSVDVRNSGAGGTPSGWGTGLYLSRDEAIDAGDVRIGFAWIDQLGPDAVITLNAWDWNIPLETQSGDYFLIAKADSENTVGETTEANNTQRKAITLNTRPDLVILSPQVSAPLLEAAGNYSVKATFTVKNIGGYPVSANWFDEAFLSAGVGLDTSDIYVGQKENQLDLQPNGSYVVTDKVFQLPMGITSGDHTLIIKADARHTNGFYQSGDRVVEENENNNTVSIPIALGQKPNLVISNPVVGTPVANTNGSYTMQVSFTVKNEGNAAAPASWYDMVFFSADGDLTTADASIGQAQRTANLAPGVSYVFSKQVTTPTQLVPDTYTLFLKADARNSNGFYQLGDRVAEGNENDNVIAYEINLNQKADLVLLNPVIGTPTPNADGTYSIQVDFRVENQGNAPAKATWYDAVYLSSDENLTTVDDFLGQQTRSTDLAPGGTNVFSKSVKTPANPTPGTYTLFLKADGMNTNLTKYSASEKVGESNENNNRYQQTISLGQKSDLVITAASVGTITVRATGAYAIPVSFTVRNQGNAPALANWNDGIYLSGLNDLDTSDLYLGQTLTEANLAAGAEYQVINKVVLTSTTQPAGAYRLFIKADGANSSGKYSSASKVVESIETNNHVWKAISLPPR